MAAQYGGSHATAHQQQQRVTTNHTKTVRKSSSGRKLKPQLSVSNYPSLFPDPYPSVFVAANASTTPPVSLFSAGSSSAGSSAYASASPASALRSSVASSDSAHNTHHQPPPFLSSPTRLSAGDTMVTNFVHSDAPVPHQVGLASTTDESVQLWDLNSTITAPPVSLLPRSTPGSRPATEYGGVVSNIEKTRWSSSSAPNSGGDLHPEGSNHRQLGGAASRDSRNSSDSAVTAFGWSRDPTTTDDEDEGYEEDELDRTAAVLGLLAEQGHGEIVHGEGKDVAGLYVPPSTSQFPSSFPTRLN
jgi:hypothetical protein